MRKINTAAALACVWALTVLFASDAHGQTHAAAPTRCNDAPASPVSYVQLPGHPFSTVASADGCWLFVSLNASNPKTQDGVALLRRSRGTVELVKVFPVAGGPTGMTLTHDGKLLIVADSEYVVFMDAWKMIAGGGGDPVLGYLRDSADFAESVYVNTTADDRLLFVSDEAEATITVIDLVKARAEGFKESAIVGKIPVGNAPIALTFSPDGRRLYTTSQIAPESYKWPIECKPEGSRDPAATPKYPQGALIVVDVERARTDPANSVAAKIPAGCSPVRLAMTPGGERVFITARNSNALLGFDTSKFADDPAHALLGTVPVGVSPVGVAVANEGKLVFVGNSNRFSKGANARQTLTVIDASKVGAGAEAVMGSVEAGAFPREFGASPDGRTLFLANYNSSELEVIDLARLPLTRK